MSLKEIMSISGHSGLFKFVSQGRNGIIVESFADGKRTHISASAKVSTLSDISIFTHDSDKPLREVLNTIKEKENGGPTISPKSTNEELKKFFGTILPDYDVDRVYVSDIKKIVTWYNQLQSVGMLDFSDDEVVADEPKEEVGEVTKEEKVAPKKKTQAKGAADKKQAAHKKSATPKLKGGDSVSKKNPHQKKT